MELSIIVPVLNEVHHIEGIIGSLMSLEVDGWEVFVVDGGSVDGTVEKLKILQKKYSNLFLMQNPEKYVSHGFNGCFPKTKGEYISLVGAHAIYPPGYFSTCIRVIRSGACDVAGGVLKQRGQTLMGEVIAIAMSSKFGVGDTPFRTSKKRQYVDSVAFAVYDRKVFEETGLLDEKLIRNQDDEFHYRINQAGFRILMLPELEVEYYVRNSLKKLFTQYFQYGLYKPSVIKKVLSGARLRHFVPFAFVSYLFLLPFFLLMGWYLLFIPLCVYLLLLFGVSFYLGKNWKERVLLPIAFLTLHLSYGLGFAKGIFSLWKK